jgi:hypothetical protein
MTTQGLRSGRVLWGRLWRQLRGSAGWTQSRWNAASWDWPQEEVCSLLQKREFAILLLAGVLWELGWGAGVRGMVDGIVLGSMLIVRREGDAWSVEERP